MNVPQAHGRRLVAVLAMLSALAPFSMDMYLPAVPSMGSDLAASTASVQMTVAVFIFGIGSGQLLFGPLSDRFGRRAPVLIGVLLYVVATVGCSLASDVGWLIGLRLLQGLGVCAGQVIANAILADLHEPRELARLSSLIVIVSGVAPMIAPLVGGAVLDILGWRAIFLTLAGYGVIVLMAVAWLIPETRSAAAMAQSRRESALKSYLLIVRNGPLMRMALIGGCGTSAFVTYLANAPALYIEQLHIAPRHFGWYFAVNVVGLMAASQGNRLLLTRHRPDKVLRGAVLAAAILSSLLLVVSLAFPGERWPLLVALFFVIATFPPIMANSMALAQGHDRSRAGAVAAVVGSFQAIVGAAAATISSAMNDGTAVPIAVTMLSGALMANALVYTARFHRRSIER